MSEKFSQRHGYAGQAREITVRQEAPPELRKAITRMARDAGMSPKEIRKVVCRDLYADPSELSLVDSYIMKEVDELLFDCEWFRVYDFAESFHLTRLLHKSWHVIVTRTPTFRVANASQNSPCSIRPCHDCRPIASVAYPHQR